MKSAILGGLSAAAMLAGTAYAVTPPPSGTTANIEQVEVSAKTDSNNANNNNSATIDQTGASANTGTDANITQFDQNNSATVVQANNGNHATVTQDQHTAAGNGNNAAVTQDGYKGTAQVYQDGSSFAQVQQLDGSSQESATIYQYGLQPYGAGGVAITQSGTREQAAAYQVGNGNTSFIDQSGTGGGNNGYVLVGGEFISPALQTNTGHVGPNIEFSGAYSEQTGANDFSQISQGGYSNLAADVSSGSGNQQTITQYGGASTSNALNEASGSVDVASITQNNGSSDATNLQAGQYDTASATQNGAGNYSLITQTSSTSASSASTTQGGSKDTSTILQTGRNEVAMVTEDGSHDLSLVTQSSLADNAVIDQGGYGDTSTVTQGGNGFGVPYQNIANVSQMQNSAVSTVSQMGYSNAAYVKQ